MRTFIKGIPIVGELARRVYWRLTRLTHALPPFPGSQGYWEQRYAGQGDSGVGSYGKFAAFKAEVLNEFVAERSVRSVIEFGCGDGNQLMFARYPRYLGFDVSQTAIRKCRELFASDPTKAFGLMEEFKGQRADLTISLDVIYHLVEDEIFEHYMQTLFGAADRYVIIYSSDSEKNRGYRGTHVRHRKSSRWVRRNLPAWTLLRRIPNRYPYRGDYTTGSFAEFFIYGMTADGGTCESLRR